ncbi:MAG: T9SS type A sorting domain-containing protein [Candidatus Zixiibacteriota bacterium]
MGSHGNCQWSETAWIPSAPRLTGHWRLTSGDLNGDDRVDLGFSHVTPNPTDTLLQTYVNLYEPGQPQWEYDTTIFRYFNDPESDSDPELADLDSDGDMDLFIYTEGQFRFYENVGGPSSPEWSERPSWLEGLDDVSHAGRFADLNRDGRFDLVLLASQGLNAYMNTSSLGQPSWTLTPQIFEDLDTLEFSYLDFSDLDGDGDEDLLGGTDGFVFYYENASVTSVEGGSTADAVPSQFFHLSCYPNPFNNSTEIMFVVPGESRVTLTVYNLLGRVLARPLDNRLPAGMHSFLWDAEGLSSGLYFYRLSTGEFSDTRKMTILK